MAGQKSDVAKAAKTLRRFCNVANKHAVAGQQQHFAHRVVVEAANGRSGFVQGRQPGVAVPFLPNLRAPDVRGPQVLDREIDHDEDNHCPDDAKALP